MARFFRGCVLGAAFLAALPAGAQNRPSQTEGSEIVVTGTRDTEQQIKDFVGALTPGPVSGQIGKFERAICPTAIGVPANQREKVAARIRAVAEGVGLQPGTASCIPNVLVVVTPDKKAFLNALYSKHGYYFGDLSSAEIRRILRQPGPAAAWQVKRMVTRDGTEIGLDQEGGVPINRTTARPSRIIASARPAFVAAVVVVESGALDGLTTIQLADYAAMRVLARTDPSRLAQTSAPTILKVLDAPMGSPVPITLTEWDLGFLRGLYASPENLRAAAHRSEIGREMGKALQEPQSERP